MIYSDPIDALLSFQQALDQFRDSTWLETGTSGVGGYPPINVFRKGEELVAIAEVPGIEKKDIEIQIRGNVIRIAGTKNVNYSEKASVHRRERLAGRFDRAISLPIEIDGDRVKAECHDGVLAVWLPRAERDRPKSIRIN
jgi:HSP20 family protein